MIDPKEVALTDRNSSCPRTKKTITKWFKGNNAALAIIEYGDYEFYPDIWNNLINYNVTDIFRFNAWITRTGKVYATGFAQHDCLLRIMGLEAVQVEDAGWLRITGQPSSQPNLRAYIRRRTTLKQRRFLKDKPFIKLFESGEQEPIISSSLIDNYENFKGCFIDD
jgi:hypothetical protein